MTMPGYTLYRLSDTIFWSVVLSGVLLCLCHAARRAFRHPLPTDAPPGRRGAAETAGDEEVERHTRFQRFFHWANFVSVAILLVSGLAIYRSPLLPFLEGSAASWFSWHQWFTPVFLALVAAHILYEYRAPSHIDHVWFGKEDWGGLALIVRNFFGLTGNYPRYRKYHPAQILFHWAIAGNLFALVLTGFVLWKPLRGLLPLSLLGLGWDFIFYNRILHGFFTATLTALILTHIYFGVFIKKNWAETRSMITGAIPRQEYVEYHQALSRTLPDSEGRPPAPSPGGSFRSKVPAM